MKQIAFASSWWLRGVRVAAHWMALVGLALGAVSANAETLTVTDDRGVSVTFAASPQRIVSLLPSLTETVCALGGCARLVGVDRYSNHPPSVRDLPRLGGGVDPDIEGVVALKPDLVLLATSTRAAPRLETLGVKVLALEPRGVADFQRVLRTIGAVLGSAEAERTLREIDAGVATAAGALPAGARSRRVYFEVNQGPYAAGPESFIGEIMSRLGVDNIVPAGLGPYPKLNPEFVVRADPDVIMIGRRSADALAQRPGWAGIRAIREGRVCRFDQDDADVLVRAGPRMAEAARLVAACLTRHLP